MSARRHVLEDSSDESESGDVGSNSNTFKFLSDNQLSEIEECNIKSDGDGTYSADAMDLAISQNEANLVQLEDEARSQLNYQQYQVMKDKIDAFLAKPIWNRSGEPSEEVLLLEIEALRRSSKKTKINMFKHNSKTGGQVMFGPWWNYALQRIVQISSDSNNNNNTGDDLDWESYTSGRILLSLFAFVTESTDVVKKGKLADLKSAFGVDWDNNVKTARKVISRYAQDSILDEECTKCELHVDSLRGALPSNDKTKNQEPVAAVPSSISLKATHSDNGDKKKPEDEEKKKREDEARKKRMAAMKASQRRASAFSVSIEQSRAKIDAVSSTTLNSIATSSMPVADLRPQPSGRPQNDAPNQMKPPPARFIPPVQAPNQMKPPPARFIPPAQAPDQMMKPPPARFIPPVQAPDQMMKPPPARFIPPVQQSTANSDPRAQQFHTATNTSSLYNSAPDDKRIESTANTTTSFASQNDYSYGQSHEPKQSATHGTYSQASSSNDGMRPQAPRDDDANDRLYRSQQDSREDRNNRYNDRSSDYGKKRDAGYEQSYNRGDSREYSTSRGYDDERPNKRSRGPDDNERSSMNYGSSAPKMGATEKWQSQQEPKTSKYEHPGPARGAAFTAPAAGGGRGRGRGGVDNRPAWMTQRGQSAPNDSAASATTVGGQQPAADPGAAFTAPAAGTGRGRGRGGVDNRPAWMTRGQGAPVNARAPASVADTQSSTVSVGEAAFSAPPTAVGRGRGRGGVDNRPAWMIKGQNAQTNNTALKPGGAAPSGGAAFGTQAAIGGMGRGRGRGRGRGIDNRPAWMSKQESQQDN